MTSQTGPAGSTAPISHAADPGRPAGPLYAALVAFILAIPLCWPAIVTGHVLVFADTPSYLTIGDRMLAMVRPDGVGASPVPDGVDAGGLPDRSGAPEGATFLRSLGYSLFLSSTVLIGGPLLPGILQGAMTVFTVLPLLPRRVLCLRALPFAVPLLLTTLPWFATLLMPDILAAVIVAYGAVLWRAWDDLSPLHRVILMLIASFAALGHYGHPPLALAVFGLVLLARLAAGRLGPGVILAAAIPVLASPAANFAATSVFTTISGGAGDSAPASRPTADIGTASMAPKRLPFLLARSIEDGPTAWYLAEACPRGEDWAICAAFDGEVPDRIHLFLWSDDGIRSLSETEMQEIREEELQLVWAAFRAYPAAQSLSLARNAGLQAVRVGLDQLSILPGLGEPEVPDDAPPARLMAAFDPITEGSALLGALTLLPLALRRRERIMPVLVILAGLALNAMIFGGLSAPVERYQARVAWLLPALALGFLATDILLRPTHLTAPPSQGRP